MRHIVGEKRHRKRIQGCLENETHFFVNSSQQQQSQSHFEELKSKQKQEQTKFTQRLLHDLELDHNKINNTPNLDKKFLNVDMIQDSPVPSHTHDPIGHQSPIPRKRLVEPTTTATATPSPSQAIRRASLDIQPQSRPIQFVPLRTCLEVSWSIFKNLRKSDQQHI